MVSMGESNTIVSAYTMHSLALTCWYNDSKRCNECPFSRAVCFFTIYTNTNEIGECNTILSAYTRIVLHSPIKLFACLYLF